MPSLYNNLFFNIFYNNATIYFLFLLFTNNLSASSLQNVNNNDTTICDNELCENKEGKVPNNNNNNNNNNESNLDEESLSTEPATFERIDFYNNDSVSNNTEVDKSVSSKDNSLLKNFKNIIKNLYSPKLLLLLCNYTKSLNKTSDLFTNLTRSTDDQLEERSQTRNPIENNYSKQLQTKLCDSLKNGYNDKIRNYILLSTAYKLSSKDDTKSIDLLKEKYKELLNYFDEYAKCHKYVNKDTTLGGDDIKKFNTINKILADFSEDYNMKSITPEVYSQENQTLKDMLLRPISQFETELFKNPKLDKLQNNPISSPSLFTNLLLRKKLTNHKMNDNNHDQFNKNNNDDSISSRQSSYTPSKQSYQFKTPSIFKEKQTETLLHSPVTVTDLQVPFNTYTAEKYKNNPWFNIKIPEQPYNSPNLTNLKTLKPDQPKDNLSETTILLNFIDSTSQLLKLLTHIREPHNVKKTSENIQKIPEYSQQDNWKTMFDNYLSSKQKYLIGLENLNQLLNDYQDYSNGTIWITIKKVNNLYQEYDTYYEILSQNQMMNEVKLPNPVKEYTNFDVIRTSKNIQSIIEGYKFKKETQMRRQFHGLFSRNAKLETNTNKTNTTTLLFIDQTKDHLFDNIYSSINAYRQYVQKYKSYNDIYLNIIYDCSIAKERCDLNKLKWSQFVLETVKNMCVNSYNELIDSILVLSEVLKSNDKHTDMFQTYLRLFKNQLKLYNRHKESYTFFRNIEELNTLQAAYSILVNIYIKLVTSTISSHAATISRLPELPPRPDVEFNLKLTDDILSNRTTNIYQIYANSLLRYHNALKVFLLHTTPTNKQNVLDTYTQLLQQYLNIYNNYIINKISTQTADRDKAADIYIIPNLFDETIDNYMNSFKFYEQMNSIEASTSIGEESNKKYELQKSNHENYSDHNI